MMQQASEVSAMAIFIPTARAYQIVNEKQLLLKMLVRHDHDPMYVHVENNYFHICHAQGRDAVWGGTCRGFLPTMTQA